MNQKHSPVPAKQISIHSANSYKLTVSDVTCITFHYITDEDHFQKHKLIYQLTLSCYVNILNYIIHIESQCQKETCYQAFNPHFVYG